jgi:hypothetical protein
MTSPFLDWLHCWQDLVGSTVVAIALLVTVWVTLRSERRKRDQDARSLRVALGAEVRQFAQRSLDIHRIIFALEPGPGEITDIGASRIQDIVRFPSPVIYPHSAPGLGLLGENAGLIVHFYNQLTSVSDVVARFHPETPVNRAQVHNIAESLLSAAEHGAKCLSAFADTPRSEHDERLRAAVIGQREAFPS